MMEKPIPAIATRALAMLENDFQKVQSQVIQEMADVAGVDLKDGWKLNHDATAFVKPDKKEPNGEPK